MKYVTTGGLCEARYGLETVRVIAAERLGTLAMLSMGPWSQDLLQAMARFCLEKGLQLVMEEMGDRHTGQLKPAYQPFPKGYMARMAGTLKEQWAGTMVMGEYSGLLYWPQAKDQPHPMCLKKTTCFQQAKDNMVEQLRAIIARYDREGVQARPYVSIDATRAMRYLLEAGTDRVDLEVIYQQGLEADFAAVLGACKCYGKNHFGADMAMIWYGGFRLDALYFKRWRTSLYHAFIRGADPIYIEHGIMDSNAYGNNYTQHDPLVVRFRQVFAEFADFTRRHPRPEGWPLANIAVVAGHLDSYVMDDQKYLWGQYGVDDMRCGDAEKGWGLFHDLYGNGRWPNSFCSGDQDVSGNPPYGQAHIIPSEISAELMADYELLVFLGWNTMTPALYRTLIAYVKQGGHLLLTLAHCNQSTHQDTLALFNGGDLRELCGVAFDGQEQVRNIWGIKIIKPACLANVRFPVWGGQQSHISSIIDGSFAGADHDYSDPKFIGFQDLVSGKVTSRSADILAVASDRFCEKFSDSHTPMLFEHRLGTGVVYLVNSFHYPGADSIRPFYREIMGRLVQGHPAAVTVIAREAIRYAVYREGRMRVIYLLNTDADLRQAARIRKDGLEFEVVIPPTHLLAVYCDQDVAVVTYDVRDRIKSLAAGPAGVSYELCDQEQHGEIGVFK